MAVPKSHHTKSKRNRRRANIFLTAPNLTACPKCGKPVLPHHACPNCGFYRGREVIDTLSKLSKKERKQREKEMKPEEGEKKPLNWEGLSKKQ
jgi:large subunit ribosomal protein L32